MGAKYTPVPLGSVHHYESSLCRLVSVFSVYSFTKAPSYFWVLSVDLRNVLCQLCPRFKTRWIIHTIFNICNNLSSRHEETLTITRVPDCLMSWMSHINVWAHVSSWQSQSSRMSGWCDLCIDILDDSGYFVSEYLHALVKLSRQICEQCFEKEEEKGEELSRKIIEKVTNDPSQIVQMTFISVCLREF